jgi:glucose/mannose-6-phosphate isomerase
MEMDALIAGFSRQLERAIEIGENASITKSTMPIHNILVTGLGGSGIGGNIVSQIVEEKLKIPMLVNKNYFIPNYVNENTLVIVSSYSGNTEETLNALKTAFRKEAKIVCVTSGGKIMEFARCNGLDYIEIDGGMPPRACFGYSFVQQLFILYYLGFLKDGFKKRLKHSIQLLKSEEPAIREEARAIAERLNNRIPIIYSDASYEGVAVRFRQQINENSKMLCWHHVIPEMNHNELVGWRNDYGKMAVVFLRNSTDFERNQKRMDFTKNVAKFYSADVIEIWSKGESAIEKVLYLIHLTDWVSYYLADLRNMDAVEVEVISKLKNELSRDPLD